MEQDVESKVLPVRDMKFVINELVGFARIEQLQGFDEVSEDLSDAVLEEAAKLAHRDTVQLLLERGAAVARGALLTAVCALTLLIAGLTAPASAAISPPAAQSHGLRPCS